MKPTHTRGGRKGVVPFDVFTPVRPVPQIPDELPPLVEDARSSPSHIGPRGSVSSLSREAVPVPFRIGEVIDDKYKVERLLGVGGMGIIVVARHLQLDRAVAIKFLRPDVAALPEAEPRFAREARAAGKMQSEHVVGILDVGALPSGLPYMVMEFLEGQDLSELVKQRGKIPISQAVEYVLQACEALAEAHSLGIIHRDLKPSNIYVTRRPDGTEVIKLLDFGIAKMTPPPEALEQEHALTTGSALMGSPLYMSPDQLRNSRDTDGRTDIWSLGAILHKLVTGHPPFMAPTIPQLCTMILSDPAEPLRVQVPETPPELEAVVSKCLEKRPEDRFQNVAQLALALASFAPQRAQVSVDRAVRVVGAAGGDVGRPLIAVTGASLPPAPASSGKAVAVESPTRLRPEGLKPGSGSMSAVRPPAPPVAELAEVADLAEEAPRSSKLVAFSAFVAAIALAALVVVTLGRSHMVPGLSRALPEWLIGGPPPTTAAPPPPAIELAPTLAATVPDGPASASSAGARPPPPPSAAPLPSAPGATSHVHRGGGHKSTGTDDEFGGRK